MLGLPSSSASILDKFHREMSIGLGVERRVVVAIWDTERGGADAAKERKTVIDGAP